MVSADLATSAVGVQGGDRLIRWCTTVSVVVLAWIAAVLSYTHMYELVLRYGEASWTAALLPLSVDGMIVASSLTLLADSRAGRRGGLLPWTLLLVGSAVSLAANVAVAEPSVIGRVIAAWPSCALIGSYELLMRQVRHVSQHRSAEDSYKYAYEATEKPGAACGAHTDAPTSLAGDAASLGAHSFEAHMSREYSPNGSYDAQMVSTTELIQNTDQCPPGEGSGAAVRADPRPGWPVSGLQPRAWHWAVANRTPAGKLPAGKVIAERFGRCERWGRLVKQTGLAGGFDRESLGQV